MKLPEKAAERRWNPVAITRGAARFLGFVAWSEWQDPHLGGCGSWTRSSPRCLADGDLQSHGLPVPCTRWYLSHFSGVPTPGI